MKIVNGRVKLLLQRLVKVFVFVIALFSVALCFSSNVEAAAFRYADFDFDSFYEENKTYWNDLCSEEGEEKLQEKCEKKLLKSQKKFYTRLYKILAKYQAAGHFIDDNVIIETIFFGLIASDFTDDSADYKKDWNTYSNSFNFDDNIADDSINVNVEYSSDEAAQKYFEKETDTLTTLIRNMIAYRTSCYGIYGAAVWEPILDENGDETGEEKPTCPNGGELQLLDVYGDYQCADKLTSFEYGFWEYYLSKYEHDEKLGIFKPLAFLKLFRSDERYDKCENWGGGYNDMYYDYEDIPTVSYDRYFDFLKYNIFYDNKYHLQQHFEETVLIPAGVECMTEDICGENSLEAKDLYDDYEMEIYEVRTDINLWIIDILNEYGLELTWGQSTVLSLEDISLTASRNSYYWPIGSSTTETRDGVVFADGEPAPVTVTSPFGYRMHPIHNTWKMHYGVDLAAPQGTNIVAIADGEVITVVSGCVVGNSSCGGGYGNYIVIAHPNGDYSLYAHLSSVDSSVQVGAGVLKGQLIGKMGTTGSSTGSHLHFEIRVGGNSAAANAVDPLTYVSASNPRPVGSSGDFSVHETSLTKEEFMAKLVNYCNGGHCTENFKRVFLMNAGMIYDVSIEYNVNPELVIVRHLLEGEAHKDKNNYWGLGCYNGIEASSCIRYATFKDGIIGFANNVQQYTMTSDMMSRYAYIGKFWYNPGGWGLGGCPYFPYISKYLSPARVTVGTQACASSAARCTLSGERGCVATNAEDQSAYAKWQVDDKMAPLRYNIFGL